MNCSSGNEQAGEGWSDYLAITLLLNPALDDPNGPRGMGPYALFQSNRQGSEAFDTHPNCRRNFQAPATRPYGSLNTVDAGDGVPLRFTADGERSLDVLTANSPFSRRVDCTTLQVPSSGASITPRELPVATETPGSGRLTVNGQGVYTYPWKTLGEWAGTCREVVVPRDDGRQHRAFFRFR